LRGGFGEGVSHTCWRLWLTPLPTLRRSVDLPLKGGDEHRAFLLPPPLRGRVREGGSPTRRAHDCLKHTFAILEQVGIPETQHTIALRLQPSISPDVVLRFRMLTAIQLDHKAPLVTNKVNDILANRSLPAKAQSIEAVGAELHPERSLGIRHLRTHRFCAETVQPFYRPVRLWRTPLPDRFAIRPPPQGGRWNIAAAHACHELSPPASVGTSSGLKP
jgi:hypothetical protein